MNILKKARVLNGLTQHDLRLKTGIQTSRLSLLERGYYKPRLDEVMRLAEALNIDQKEILSEESR